MKLIHTNRELTNKKNYYAVWLFRIRYHPDLFLQVEVFFRKRESTAQGNSGKI